MKCIVRIVMLICLTVGLFASPLCVFAEDSKTSTGNEVQGTTTSAVIPYDNSVLTRTTDNIKGNFTSNSISGYSFNDMIPLVDGWVIIGDVVKKEVLIVNAISGEVAKEYKLDAAPDRIDLNPEKGKIIASQKASNNVALIDACNDEVRYISTSGPAVDVAFAKDNYAAIILTDAEWRHKKISMLDWINGMEVASVDEIKDYGCIACDKNTNNILVVSYGSPGSLSRFVFNEDKKVLEKKEYFWDIGEYGQSLAISPDGLHAAVGILDIDATNINNKMGEWNVGDYPTSAAFSKDSKYLIVANSYSVKLFDVETHIVAKTITNTGGFRIVGISNGGKIAFAASDDGKLLSYLISVPVLNSIICSNPVFDLANPQDIVVNMEGSTLRTIKNGSALLTGSDYSILGNTVTIKKSYLTYFFNKFNLPGQKLNLTFDFDSSNDPVLTIASVPVPNSIKCNNPVFNPSNPQDMMVNVTGAALKVVKNGTAILTSEDYSISGNIVTIKKEYLTYFFTKFMSAQMLFLTFDFESGYDPVFTITNCAAHISTYDNSVLSGTTDNIKDSSFESNSISGYSFSDMVPLVDGWMIVGDNIKNRVLILNALSGEVAKEYQLKASPGEIDFNAEKGKIIVSQILLKKVALIDVYTGEVKYIPISGTTKYVAFAGDSYAVTVLVKDELLRKEKISILDWSSGEEVASIDEGDRYGSLGYDKATNNILVHLIK